MLLRPHIINDFYQSLNKVVHIKCKQVPCRGVDTAHRDDNALSMNGGANLSTRRFLYFGTMMVDKQSSTFKDYSKT